MGKVNFLSEDIISKIAAGEVVESPASVVKELIENSIDANSENIEVNIEKSGKKLIFVKDNGEGIEPDDIEKIFERYSTSKIKEKEDLYKIKTLGFRGEALYSISSVSDIILKSKTKNNQTGKEIHVRGGKKLGIKDCGMVDGTIVEVRELFFNVPARRKFLKSELTEFRKVLNVFVSYAICFPEINFIFKNEDKKIFNFTFTENYLERFCEVLNLNEKYLIYDERNLNEIEIRIIVGDINLKRTQKDIQFIFINKRPVYNYVLSTTINNFYKSIFPSEFFPVFAIFLKIPYENIDVNIHPTKKEIKIENENEIAKKILKILEEMLKRSKVRTIDIERKYEIEEKNAVKNEIKEKTDLFNESEKINEELFLLEKKESILRERIKKSFFIGIFKSKYLIFETDNSLLLIDQHAAMERINYELFINEIEKNKIQVQQLLTPLIINLSPEEMLIWENVEKILEKYGFLTTRWSENKIAIHGYPSLIKDIEFSIRNILAEKDTKKYDKEDIAKRACRISIMAGEKLNEKEVIYIIEKLIECKNPFVCPHGRPIIIELTENFIDRQFLR